MPAIPACAIRLSGLFFAVALSTSLHATDLRVYDHDPFATARAGAFAATADEPSAIYYNPAGITQLKGHQTRSGMFIATGQTHFESPTGEEVDSKYGVTPIPYFFYTYSPDTLPLSFGIGLYVPYGNAIEWPENSAFRATTAKLTYLSVNPVVAWKAHPTLSVAAGPSFNYARTTLKQRLFSTTLFPPGGRLEFKGDDTDFGYTGGILWQPHPKHSFGFSYHSATTMEFEGHSETSGADAAGVPSLRQSASARFHFSQFIKGGWSFRPTPSWNFEFDVDWTDWGQLDSVTLEQDVNPATIPFNWRSSFCYSLGATRYLANGWRVSAGYAFCENAVPDRNFNPIVPDRDLHVVTVGVGKKGRKWSWELAYLFGYGPDREVSNNSLVFPIGSSANGTYRTLFNSVNAAIGYHF
ncbi:MAG: outer membrane protein transport protein [Verrucomicrobia subdivision 3 bacterium]|nr:outer membrane protein transport protein [Limisphaerales bacterium]